jgi:hypothetical protein
VKPAPSSLLDNQTYYFVIGHGEWRGSFSFRITSREKFRQAPLGLKNRLLLLGMRAVYRLFGKSRIDSKLWADRDRGVAGVAGNTVRISKFGLTLYLLKETYTLAQNGSDVEVHAHERFGPIPFLLTNEKRHPAIIHEHAQSSTYYIPLLGANWVASYTVHPDRAHIDGHLTCAFAEAWEIIHKLGGA